MRRPRSNPRLAAPRWLVALCLALTPLATPAQTPPASAAPASSDLEALLARARAYVGPEDALNAVQSLHFTGTIKVSADNSATIDVLFAQPFRHRVEVRVPARIEVTALDGYEGWQRVQNLNKPEDWRLTLLQPAHVRRLRALTAETLSYYRLPAEFHGRVEDLGPVEIDGIACRRVKFWHDEDIHFTRTFDIATGRLVQTDTADGARVRDEGEIKAGGLRFPARQITTTRGKNPAGESVERTVVITFEQITVNQPVEASTFAVPALTSR